MDLFISPNLLLGFPLFRGSNFIIGFTPWWLPRHFAPMLYIEMSSTFSDHAPYALERQLYVFVDTFELELDEPITIDSDDEGAPVSPSIPIAIYNSLFPSHRIPMIPARCVADVSYPSPVPRRQLPPPNR